MSLEHSRSTENAGSILDGYQEKTAFAAEVDKTERTIDRWIERGLPYVQLGNKKYIRIEAARQYLLDHEQSRAT